MKYVPKPLVYTADGSRGRPTLQSRLQFVFTVVLTLVFLWFGSGLLARILVRVVPDSWETRMASLDRTGLEDDADLEHPRRILERLMQGEQLRSLNYRLVLVPFSAPNAVALLGGTIGVTTGLLEEVETDAGLAFVLAHELGHHEHRDLLRVLGRGLLLDLAVTAMTGGSTMNPLDASRDVAENTFSRQQELQADRYAHDLVLRKYGDTPDALEFFEKILAHGDEPEWQKYFSSHPLTRERMERLRALSPED